MGIDNVKLWFAKNENEEIVTIDDLKDSNTYSCPVCGSDLTPKAIESKRIAPHFAHVDKSKCQGESYVHFWFKNRFLEQGDKFKVVTNKEIEYVCKDILVEQQYDVGDKIYRPDVTIITECGKTIYFEMNYSNKKEVKDYIDIWLELKNVVVEIDIKQLMNKESLPSFKALFYEGKCFNTKRNDTYYNTIGKHKEELCKNGTSSNIRKRVKKLDWFWEDVIKYKKGEVNIDYMAELITGFEIEDANIINKILKKSTCSRLYKDYKHFMTLDNDVVYWNKPKEDYFIIIDLSAIQDKLKEIDDNFTISFDIKKNYKSESYYNGSRKHMYKYRNVLSHYTSKITLKYRGKIVERINVTNRFLEKYDFNDLFSSILQITQNHKLRIKCISCGSSFFMQTKEVKFYDDKGFTLPKRCKSCRNKRKQSKGEIK